MNEQAFLSEGHNEVPYPFRYSRKVHDTLFNTGKKLLLHIFVFCDFISFAIFLYCLYLVFVF